MRKTLAVYGPKRRTVRVFTEGALVRVQWRERGELRTKSWELTRARIAEAKAWAEGFAESREDARPATKALTLRELWTQYADAEFPHLRERSRALYAEYWAKWERVWGRTSVAADATPAMIDDFRRKMTKLGRAVTYTREIVRTVRRVYRWAEERELLERNRLESYRFKIGKDQRTESPAEYSTAEYRAILAALDPEKATQWRAWVALSICGEQGARQHAVLHLRWADIGREHIAWPAEFDKVGREWEQPIRPTTREALAVAWRWRERTGYDGPWVLPCGSRKSRSEVYTKGSLWLALRGAEERAGVARIRRRSAHGLRRMLAGNVAAATGNAALAMRSIGDTDIRMADRYLKTRPADIADAFDRLDAPRTQPEATSPDRHGTVTDEGGSFGPPSQNPD